MGKSLVCLGVLAGLLMSGLSGCSEDRGARARPRYEADTETLKQHWNAGHIEAFVAHVDATRYLPDRDQAVFQITDLWQQLGSFQNNAGTLVDSKPCDPRAYVVAHQVMAAEQGVAHLALVYDKNLRIVGFHIRGQPMPATPR